MAVGERDRRLGTEPADSRARRIVALGYPIAIGVATTVVGIPLAMAQAAGGHGPTWLMAALFPWAMVAAGFISDAGSPGLAQLVGLALAVLILPAYGLVIGLAWLGQLDWLVVRMIAFLHILIAAILIISGERFV